MTPLDEYHKLYEKSRVWEKNTWFGIPCWKLPMDAFVIQELIVRLRPEYIIETGTAKGGSAMFYASICELLGEGSVITIDINLQYNESLNEMGRYEWTDRIRFVHGGSTNPLTYDEVYAIARGKRNMVILDSWHTKEHVLKEMAMYSKLVPKGSYMIVEDTHSNGHPVPWKWGDGPFEAVEEWLSVHGSDWEIDYECEKHLFTFNPKGYLKRKE